LVVPPAVLNSLPALNLDDGRLETTGAASALSCINRGDGVPMHHNERWNILAGLVFAALFVAVLLCFSRTTYVLREASPVTFDRPDITVAHR
jgi:hypothetical protein